MKLTRTVRRSRGAGEVLGDLRRVPVHAADAVRRRVAHHLAAEQVRLGGLAGAAGAGRGDHHDVGLDQPGGDRRGQGEGRDGRVAAGHRDPGGAGQRAALARQLGQAVGPGAGVAAAVEPLPRRRVGQPVVGAAVDDHDLLPQLGRDRAGLAVREGEEDHVVAGQRRGAGLLEHPVGQRDQVRLQAAQRSRRRWTRRSARRSRPRGGPAAGAAARRRRTRWLRRPRPSSSSCCMTIQTTVCTCECGWRFTGAR